ncbi:iron complex transport system substrate-binding protein [Rhizobiales bacterium GAS188]|nr:iron complex transport system substrate-binding protein [Rhizobiales bacterium GAS188]
MVAGLAAAGLLLAGFGSHTVFLGSAKAQAPERIMALGGAVTEILYALSLQDRIVGLDTTSLYPPQALKDKPNVGYLRAVSAEGILSLRPSLVIALDGAGPADALKLVADAGVPIMRLPEDPTQDGVIARIEAVGRLVGAEQSAGRLANRTRAGFAQLEALRSRLGRKVRVLFLLSLQNGRPVVAGRKTTADGMIGLAGAVNAADMIQGFKPMTEEAVIAAAPDAIVMMSNAGVTLGSDEVFSQPAFAATPAARNRVFISMDGLYLLGFGPRTPEAARDLMSALYPEFNLPPLDLPAYGPTTPEAAR